MYKISNEKFNLFPLAFNDFCNDIASLSESLKYSGGVNLDRIIDAKMIDDILQYCCQNSQLLYVIDMRYVIAYENKIFSKLIAYNNLKMLIVNIKSDMVGSIKEDLQNQYLEADEGVLCSDIALIDQYNKIKSDIKDVYHKEAVTIVNWMRQNVTQEMLKDLKPLDSSGVYCNMYINAKRLFTDPDKYYLVIYLIVCMILENDQDIDAIVSASRNGANLASIIGWLVNKKVIHCTNLGPRFSLVTSSLHKDIRKNKKYIYIFDFLCLGTEVKVLNALLSYKGAILVNGYGIANYISIEENEKTNVIGKMKSLVDVQREHIGYMIAGSRDEIKNLLQEDVEYVSGLYRI